MQNESTGVSISPSEPSTSSYTPEPSQPQPANNGLNSLLDPQSGTSWDMNGIMSQSSGSAIDSGSVQEPQNPSNISCDNSIPQHEASLDGTNNNTINGDLGSNTEVNGSRLNKNSCLVSMETYIATSPNAGTQGTNAVEHIDSGVYTDDVIFDSAADESSGIVHDDEILQNNTVLPSNIESEEFLNQLD